jgi:hypothetical protein
MIGRKSSAVRVGIVAACVLVGVVGCSGEAEKKPAEAPVIPTQGTHGGKLVPLGANEWHVEIVPTLDTSVPNVSFYLLDSTGKKKQLISALEMVVNTKVGGKATEHKVFSAPQDGEIGQTSRFRATEKVTVDAITAPGTELEIIVTSGDKKLTGTIKNEAPATAATATATGTAATTKPSGTAATPSPTASGSATATSSGTAEKK